MLNGLPVPVFVLNVSLRNEPEYIDLFRLTNPMGTIHSLEIGLRLCED